MDNSELPIADYNNLTVEEYLTSRQRLLQIAEIDSVQIKSLQDLSSSYSGLGEELFKATVFVGKLKSKPTTYPNEEAEFRIQNATEAYINNGYNLKKLVDVADWYKRIEKKLENNHWEYSVDSEGSTYRMLVDNPDIIKLIKLKGDNQEFVVHLPVTKQISEPFSRFDVIVDQTPVDKRNDPQRAASVIQEFIKVVTPTLPDSQKLGFEN